VLVQTTPITPSIKYNHCSENVERDSVHSVEGDGSITDSGRGPSEEGGDGRTSAVAPRDRYLPPPPPPPRGGAYWAQQQPLLQPSHRAHTTAAKTQSHPTVRFHGLSTMPEEDADDGLDVAAAGGSGDSLSKLSPGRQLGRRAAGGPHSAGRPSSRVYHAPAAAANQRFSDDSSYLLPQDRCPTSSAVRRPVVQQHTVAANDPPTTADDQHSLLQNGFVRDRERLYHDNSVVV